MTPRVPLALLAILPAGLMMAYFLIGDITFLADPCHTWGVGAGGSARLEPGGACASGRSGSSQTLREYVLMMLAIKGSVFASLALVVTGLVSARGSVTVVAAWATAVVSVPLMFSLAGHVVLLSAGLALACARVTRDLRGAGLWGARALALLAMLFYASQMASAIASGILAFQVATGVELVTPGLMLWAAWWPQPAPSASPGA